MELLDLPSEILCEIVSLCGPGAVTQTCRTFADIAVSTPALWSSVRLGPLQCIPEGGEHLYRRLSRTADSPLTVSVGPVQDEEIVLPDLSPGGIIGELCIIISEWSAQISHLHVHAETTVGAGVILHTIFHDFTSSVIFFALQSLSVRVDSDYEFLCDCLKPMDVILSSVLAGSHRNFPRLQFLSIPTFSDCLPSFPANATFSHLHTLVLDGARQEGATDICTVTEFLSNTPQLQTLWLKHDNQDPNDAAFNPVPNWEMYNGDYPLRVFLPHLVRLAASAPGTGTDLLYCLEAPSLEDLHIDGSRPSPPTAWLWHGDDEASMQAALSSFASRSSGLRRLAFTQASMVRCGFEWLLFGDGGRPPFPRLETLAFHGYPEQCGLDDDLLLRFAQKPTIPLHRLVFLQCALSFKGSTLIQVYQRVIANAPNEKYELEIDCPCGQITDENLDTLEEIGVHLTRRREGEAKIDKWWSLDHEVDASDSCAY